MDMNKKDLTRAEEQIMQYLWKIGKGFVRDIVEEFPGPRPAYTTVTTLIRILVRKGFIGFNAYGKANEYYPVIGKKEYITRHLKNVVKNYFNGSAEKFASFFTRENDLSVSELEELRKHIDELIDKRRSNE